MTLGISCDMWDVPVVDFLEHLTDIFSRSLRSYDLE